MLPRMIIRSLARRAGALFVCLAFLALAGLVAPGTAAAQGYGWFGGLFGGGRPLQQQPQPSFPSQESGPSQGGGDYVPRHRARHHPKEQTQAQRPAPREAVAEKAPPPPQKKNATTFVYVFGDTFGQALAAGLDDALADRQDVAVVHKAKGPTGLVNSDYFDWPKAIDTLLAGKDKIDVAVMMLGSNDRQPISEGGKTYDVGSDDWKRIYDGRVMAIDEAFKKKGIPLIWVGVPITKSTDFADTMALLNDVYRDDATKTGATYVDTWEPFSDDNGDFAAYGPDVDGQIVKLRSADGILLTHAGARKLAHFVEAPIRRILDGKAPAPMLPTDAQAQGAKSPDGKPSDGKPSGKTSADAKGEAAVKAPAPKPEAGPIVNLNQLPSDAHGELAAPTAYRGSADGSAAADVTPAGRADDARWPTVGTKSP